MEQSSETKWVTDWLTIHNESASGSLPTYLYIVQLWVLRVVQLSATQCSPQQSA